MSRSKLSRRLLAAAVCAAAVASTTVVSAGEASYEMISYVDFAGGRELLSGDYGAAIEAAGEAARTADGERRLAAVTNLCVAYTIERKLPEALAACDRALTLAMRADAQGSLGAHRSTRETAKAMTNRGVLKVVSGDMDGAMKDLRAAARMRSLSATPARNVARFESRSGSRMAAASAGH